MNTNCLITPVLTLLTGLLVVSCSPVKEEKAVAENLSQYVEPRIGTAHCRWFHFTPARCLSVWRNLLRRQTPIWGITPAGEATGYDYRDTSIEGFPCLHEFQVGGIVLMPTVGELKTVPGAVNDSTGSGYRSRFDHSGRDCHCRLLFCESARLPYPGRTDSHPSCGFFSVIRSLLPKKAVSCSI